MDKDGFGIDAKVAKQVVKKPGSEPIRDWGRDIEEPCPSKENSEVDPKQRLQLVLSRDEFLGSRRGCCRPEHGVRVLGPVRPSDLRTYTI